MIRLFCSYELELSNTIMQNQRYWKLPWKTCSRYIVSGLPFRNYSVCSPRMSSPLIQLARCTHSQVWCRPADNVWTAISRYLHPPAVTALCMSQTRSSVPLKQKQLNNLRPYHSDSKEPKSAFENKTTQQLVASCAESVYQTLVKKDPWLYPYSRTVAFSKSRNSRTPKPRLNSPELEDLINQAITTDSVEHMSVEEMCSVFRDLTHAGLEATHPLMTCLFLQLQSKQKSLDFVSLGQFLSAVENYNSSHIIIEKEILPQLGYLLQNGCVKLEKDPKLFLDVLCHFSSCGLLQQIDSDLISNLLLQILSLCRDHRSIVSDLDLVVQVFQLVSVFMLGDHRLAFIEPNIQDISGIILKHITDVMSANIQQLNLHQLCAITAMSAEEHMEFLSKPFLEKVQSRMESIIFEMQDFSMYNILELQQLANLSWMKLSAKCKDKILRLTWGCLQNPVAQSLPLEMVIFLKRSRAISDLLCDRDISVTAKESLNRAFFDFDIMPHLKTDDFVELYDTTSLYFSSTGSKDDFGLQCLSEVLSSSLLDMTDRLQRLHFVVLVKHQMNTTPLTGIFNEKLAHCYNLNELKKLINTIASAYVDTYYHNLVHAFTRVFRTTGRERTEDRNDIRQFFLLGYDIKTSSRVKLCGLPSWRLQQQFRDLFRPCMHVPTDDLRNDILYGLTFLCDGHLDPHEFEMACWLALSLSPSSYSQFQCNLLEYAIKHQTNMKISNFIDLLQISLKIGPQGTQQRLLQAANNSLNQLTIDAVEPPVLVQMLCSMSDLMDFPQNYITKVFRAPYINKVMDLLHSPDLSYNQSQSLLNNIVELNRKVCLLCPDYAVPYQRRLIEAHPEPGGSYDAQLIHYLIQKQSMQDTLTSELGGPEFVRTNYITSDGIHIDMVAYFNEDCNVVKYSELDHMRKAGKYYTKLAVIFLHKDQYLLRRELPSIQFESRQIKASLRVKGYKVIWVSCWKKEKYYVLVKRAKRLLGKVYRELEIDKGEMANQDGVS
ncbi:uncharacterized protein LOC110442346 isoform X2 [Mizuhopecten yessoensis]|uniref:uncharacterized protein LOC110442346 isoform X2 n=1 Tax=Mizuhopecten yessoensis TaxID=6573 RepID=UPI000B45C59F|nr:uncharacterized protein LOC110442346 isoform X2 [Mizuhopecten yessoensis]